MFSDLQRFSFQLLYLFFAIDFHFTFSNFQTFDLATLHTIRTKQKLLRRQQCIKYIQQQQQQKIYKNYRSDKSYLFRLPEQINSIKTNLNNKKKVESAQCLTLSKVYFFVSYIKSKKYLHNIIYNTHSLYIERQFRSSLGKKTPFL